MRQRNKPSYRQVPTQRRLAALRLRVHRRWTRQRQAEEHPPWIQPRVAERRLRWTQWLQAVAAALRR